VQFNYDMLTLKLEGAHSL